MNYESRQHALAYLMGSYLSDGNVHRVERYFRLSVTDKEFRDTVVQAMEMAGARYTLNELPPGSITSQVTGKVYRGKRKYQVREKFPYVVGWWLEGVFPDGRDRLPAIADDLVRELVAGIMDGDGCISLRKKGFYQLVVCGSCGYLADLQSLFAKHRVKMYYRPVGMNHTINLKSFVKAGFYFRLSRKQDKLQKYKEVILGIV